MILNKIVASTKERVERLKKTKPFELVRKEALGLDCGVPFSFEKALTGDEISFICEVKKASPSKGIIAKDFPYLQIAKDYEKAGASAISVLTEPNFFMGSDQYLREIADIVNIPVLRKDFIIDPYQIYEARVIGASAILLICSLLDVKQLKEYIDIADSVGLSALVEVHDRNEVAAAIEAGARVIGVNNRDLRTFSVDINNSVELRSFIPQDTIFVSESGIKTAEHIRELYRIKTDAVLIGEMLMCSADKRKALEELKGGIA